MQTVQQVLWQDVIEARNNSWEISIIHVQHNARLKMKYIWK